LLPVFFFGGAGAVFFESLCNGQVNKDFVFNLSRPEPPVVFPAQATDDSLDWFEHYVWQETCGNEAYGGNGGPECGGVGYSGQAQQMIANRSIVVNIMHPMERCARGITAGFLGCEELQSRFRVKDMQHEPEEYIEDFYFWVSQNVSLIKEYAKCTRGHLTRRLAGMASKQQPRKHRGENEIELAVLALKEFAFVGIAHKRHETMCTFHARFAPLYSIYHPPFMLAEMERDSLTPVQKHIINAMRTNNIEDVPDTVVFNRAYEILLDMANFLIKKREV
jgi:hypothetical protein